MKKMILICGVLLNVIFGLGGKVYATNESALPELFIKAVNPGYTIDGKSNVGEMIEIGRKESDEPVLLAGTTVGYTNSSGNYSELFRFPENSWMTGETILLRLASSPGSELAAVNYTKTLAFKAGIELKREDKTIDEVCWTGKTECYTEFKSSNPTTLVRNLETGLFEHKNEYAPDFNEKNYEERNSEEKENEVTSQCKGVEFSEILSYFETTKAEQFIEFHNNTAEQVLLDGCKIRYKNKTYNLSGVILADEYTVYYPQLFSLTKNPTNRNVLELIDTNGEVIDTLIYGNGQRKGTAYAWIGYDESGKKFWRVTYDPTPGAPNNFQEFKTCEAGKVINEATGNCVKVTTVSEKVCPEGQYLNILTGRCRKKQTTTEKVCKEGYYLNPETNRCRKIVENTGADYNLKPEEYEESFNFVALYAVLGVVGIGIIYLIFEFRHEIGKLFGKVFRRSR